MKIVIGSDHAGFELKEALAEHLRLKGHEIVDLGTTNEQSVDYPDYGAAVGRAVTGGQAVTRQRQPRLYNLLENLCISRGIPMPKLKIIESDARNAFATGLNQRQYAITVTTGLLNALNDQELEAVLGHELTHIPQRRRADDGDRGDHCRRSRLFCRIAVPEFY